MKSLKDILCPTLCKVRENEEEDEEGKTDVPWKIFFKGQYACFLYINPFQIHASMKCCFIDFPIFESQFLPCVRITRRINDKTACDVKSNVCTRNMLCNHRFPTIMILDT